MQRAERWLADRAYRKRLFARHLIVVDHRSISAGDRKSADDIVHDLVYHGAPLARCDRVQNIAP